MNDGLPGGTSLLNLPTDSERSSAGAYRPGREQTVVAVTAADASVPPAAFAAFQILVHRLSGLEAFTVRVAADEALDTHRGGEDSADGRGRAVECRVSGASRFGELVAASTTGVPKVAIPAGVAGTGPAVATSTLSFAVADLSVHLAPGAGRLDVACDYNAELFEPGTIRRWLEAFGQILVAGLADPGRDLVSLPWVSEGDLALMRQWNQTGAAFPDACVHELIAAQVGATPDAVAVEFNGTTITYGDLHREARQLSARLRARGVGAGSLVGLSTERSIDMFVGVLGILEAGAAYVPLDPTYPADRLAFMIEDSGMRALVTQRAVLDTLSLPSGLDVVLLDVADSLSPNSDAVPGGGATPDDIAYVIYTSGSTGRPKGVLVPHRCVVNLLESVRVRPGMSAADVVLAITTLSFDIAVSEVLLPLTVGARVVLADKDTASDGVPLLRLVEDRAVTFIDATPSTWRLLLDAGWRGRDGVTSICTGEAMPRDLARQLSVLPGRVWNAYGPTETTVWSTFQEIVAPVDRILIGTAVANTQLYVLDERGAQVPVGVAGELFIAGAGVTNGYLNRPELTQERFVSDPFAPGATMYRTGDIARFLNDGTMECLGRIDDQVKIRGFRIELGEVEEVLTGHEGVARAAVVAREDRPGDKRLVAYIVARPGAAPAAVDLRRRARTRLPDFMVPSVFVFLDLLPLTPSGKVNRRALPAPTVGGGDERPIVGPRTEMETVLVELWRRALGVEQVSVDDDFFLLGGHSLSASYVLARLRRDHHVDVPFRALFEAPTIAQLAHVIETRPQTERGRAPQVIERAVDAGPTRLSVAQERMWLLEAMDPHQQVVHNLPFAWQFDGDLDVPALERSLNGILGRHESLRTRIIVRDGQAWQEVVEAATLKVSVVDLSSLDELSRQTALADLADTESRIPHDLSAAPLMRATLFRIAETRHILLIVPHNLIWDGWSFEVFVHELVSLYAAATHAAAPPLPDLPVAYRDFARWQREWLEGPEAAQQRAWWSGQLGAPLPVLQLPADRPRPEDMTREAVHVEAALSRAEVDALSAVGRETGATLFGVLFAALCVVLHRVSGQGDLLIGVPVRARTRPEIEDLIGPFMNMLVLRSRADRETTFSELLAKSRSSMLDALSHQELPLEAVDARAPILRAFFTFEDGRQRPERMGDLAVSTYTVLPPAVAADVRFAATETRDGLSMVWTCSAEIFERESAGLFLQRFRHVLDEIVKAPHRPVSEIEFLGEAERALLESFETPAERPADADVSVHTLIARHAARTPNDVAVVHGDETIDYSTFDRRANAVARALRDRGVDAGARVAIYLARSADYVTALLGIMKAGAVCVTLDPADPPARVTAILEDSNAAAVVSDSARRRQLPEHPLPVVSVDEIIAVGRPISFEPVEGAPDAPACLLYACESRQLRSIAVTHGALAGLLASVRDELSLTHEDVWLAISPTSLDVSLIELLAPLAASGCVVIADDDVALDSERLTEVVGRSSTTVMVAPTSLWQDLLSVAGATSTWPRLKAIAFGTVPGRQLSSDLANRTSAAWYAHSGSPEAIWTTIHRLTESQPAEASGKPLAHVALRVVEGDDRLRPIGVTGRLDVRVVMPSGDAGRRLAIRLMPSEHLARWRSDGTLHIVSAPPREAYIDGFRIDLDDAASIIRRHAAVEDAEVIVESGISPERLVACVVPRRSAPYSVSDVRRELRRTVPAALVPRTFVEVGTIPRAPDGRVHFEMLLEQRPAADGYAAPETPTEVLLAGLWSEAIGVPRVGAHDNFFALGGYSLLCFQVLERMERNTGTRISPRHLLLDTLRQVAAHLDSVNAARDQAPPKRESGGGMLQRLRRLVPRSAERIGRAG